MALEGQRAEADAAHSELAKKGARPAAERAAVVLTLMVSLTVFTILYAVLMIQAYQLQRAQTLAQRLRAGLE